MEIFYLNTVPRPEHFITEWRQEYMQEYQPTPVPLIHNNLKIGIVDMDKKVILHEFDIEEYQTRMDCNIDTIFALGHTRPIAIPKDHYLYISATLRNKNERV